MIIMTTGTAPTVTIGQETGTPLTLTHPETYDLLGPASVYDAEDIANAQVSINNALLAGTITAETQDGEPITEIPGLATSISEINGKTGNVIVLEKLNSGDGTTQLEVFDNGDVRAYGYPSTRDDGPVDQNRIVYMDPNGVLQVGKLDKIWDQLRCGGRIYCYGDQRWVYPNSAYGPNYFQINLSAGIAALPAVHWYASGYPVTKGTILKHIYFGGRSNEININAIEGYVRIHNADFFDPTLTIDSAAESNAVEVIPVTDFTDPANVDTRDKRMFKIPLNDFVVPVDCELHIYFRSKTPPGGNRFYYCNYNIEMEIPIP